MSDQLDEPIGSSKARHFQCLINCFHIIHDK